MSTKFLTPRAKRSEWSPAGRLHRRLRVNIALAYVPPALAALGTQLFVKCGRSGEGFGGANAVLQARQKISAASNSRFELTWQISARGGKMAYPANYRYTKEHEWVNAKDGVATMGITDYAQHELGDVVFVELPESGQKA